MASHLCAYILPCCCPHQTTAQLKINEAYKKDLIGQIQARVEQKRSERTEYLEEGKKMRQQQQLERAELEQVGCNHGVG